jgi:hypothetical protein
MADRLFLKEYLGFDEFGIETGGKGKDPGKDDITFIIQVIRMIPKTPEDMGNIDPKVLASYCLAAHALANEYFSKATLWYEIKRVHLDAMFGSLISNASGPATVAKEIAKSKDEYKKLAEEVAIATGYIKYYTGVLKILEAAHYWSKEKEKYGMSERNMAGYEPDFGKGGLPQVSKRVARRDTDPVESGDVDFTKM